MNMSDAEYIRSIAIKFDPWSHVPEIKEHRDRLNSIADRLHQGDAEVSHLLATADAMLPTFTTAENIGAWREIVGKWRRGDHFDFVSKQGKIDEHELTDLAMACGASDTDMLACAVRTARKAVGRYAPYKEWYEEAVGASNAAGFVGVSAADTIRRLNFAKLGDDNALIAKCAAYYDGLSTSPFDGAPFASLPDGFHWCDLLVIIEKHIKENQQ